MWLFIFDYEGQDAARIYKIVGSIGKQHFFELVARLVYTAV